LYPFPFHLHLHSFPTRRSSDLAGELIFSHEFIVTNLTNLTAETAFELYHKRGQMENYIKEAKTGFFFDKTDSSTFNANAARMMRSEEHTSELQSRFDLVCRLLL